MGTIHTVSSKTVPYPALRVWEVITNVSSYKAWWPSSIKITTLHMTKGLLGSQIEVRPYGGLGFVCEVVDMTRYTELKTKYSGIYTGSGMWTISETNGQSRVTYEITLEIQNRWIRLLSSVLPVTQMHSRLMDGILSGLARYLEETKLEGDT